MNIIPHPGNTRKWVSLANFHTIGFCLLFLVHCTPLIQNYPGQCLWGGTYGHRDLELSAYRFKQPSFQQYLFVNSIRQNHLSFRQSCSFLFVSWRDPTWRGMTDKLEYALVQKLEYLVSSSEAWFPSTDYMRIDYILGIGCICWEVGQSCWGVDDIGK